MEAVAIMDGTIEHDHPRPLDLPSNGSLCPIIKPVAVAASGPESGFACQGATGRCCHVRWLCAGGPQPDRGVVPANAVQACSRAEAADVAWYW